MPRTSRSVAQRLASQAKSRKRRPRGPGGLPGTVAPDDSTTRSPSVDEILDEVVPSAAGSRAASTPTLGTPATGGTATAPVAQSGAPSARRRASSALGRAGVRTPVVRRRYAEYAEEYRYVLGDLKRILFVGGVLAVLLVVLTFFIQ